MRTGSVADKVVLTRWDDRVSERLAIPEHMVKRKYMFAWRLFAAANQSSPVPDAAGFNNYLAVAERTCCGISAGLDGLFWMSGWAAPLN